MTTGSYWAVAQTVSRMEHIVRREIEKLDRGAFLPTYGRYWKVDGRQFAKEYPLLGGYVFFLTRADNYAGVPDIDGVYRVLANPDGSAKRVGDAEMARLVLGHAGGNHNRIDAAKFTKYYRPEPRRKRRRPRPGKRIRSITRA